MSTHALEQLRERLATVEVPDASPLSTGVAGLDELLSGGGLPGGVTELSSPHRLGGSTWLALQVVKSAQAQHAEHHCAWFDTEANLHAPGLLQRGVDLSRLYVIRPPLEKLCLWVVKTLASEAFVLVVVDLPRAPRRRGTVQPDERWARRLSHLARVHDTRVLLLSDALEARAQPWPVALRLRVEREEEAQVSVVVEKRVGAVSEGRRRVACR